MVEAAAERAMVRREVTEQRVAKAEKLEEVPMEAARWAVCWWVAAAAVRMAVVAGEAMLAEVDPGVAKQVEARGVVAV